MPTEEKKSTTPAPAASPAPTADKPEETIVVKKSALDALIAKVDMLTAVADKGRLQRYQAANQTEQNRNCRVSMLGGKVIVGWATVKNEVQKNMSGIWSESQVVQIVTEDGEKSEMPYIEFARVPKVQGEIVGRSNEGGVETLKIRMEDGRVVSLDRTFVN